MADYAAGKRYAQAAFAIAKESGAIPQWRSDLEDIAAVLTDSDAAPVFANGRIAVERRIAMVERALDVQPLALNLARLLVSKGRTAEARAVSDAFNRMADDLAGVEQATITTAVQLSPAELATIEQQLSSQLGKQVRASANVDPSLLGGVVVRVGDKLIDGSVKARLERLRRELQGAR